MKETKKNTKNYTVGIQVIRVFRVNIKAKNEDEAIDKAYEMESNAIEKDGNLMSVDTDYAEIAD